MQRLRRLPTAVALMLGISLVAACSSSPSGAPGTSSSGSAPTSGNTSTSASPAQSTPVGASKAFDWRSQSGKSIKLLLVKHPLADTMLERLPQFEQLTGIKVTYDSIHEEQFFDKLTTEFAGRSSEYDAYMVGSYMIWQYAPAKYMEPLDGYIKDPSKTSPEYDPNDFLPFLIKDQKWDLVDGHPTGTGNLYALPWSFHTSNLIYRKSVLKECGVDVPRDLEQLYQAGKKLKQCRPDMVPLLVRGSRSWATIHPSVMSWFTSYGGKDFEVAPDGKLSCALDKNQEAVAAHELWGKIIREVAQTNYADYTWYDVANTFSSGKAAMFYDADIIAYFTAKDSKFPQDWGIAPPPVKPGGKLAANEWIWSIGMNAFSKNKDAAWLWMQWSTSKNLIKDMAINGVMVDPVRQSTWDSPEFQKKMNDYLPGYLDAFKELQNHTQIYYTPQKAFFETTTEWAAALQRIHGGTPAAQALKDACTAINKSLN